MAFYFRYVPNLEYINRTTGEGQISNYVQTKNLFKRSKLREDIFGNLTFFTKYSIIGDERPDNVAEKVYSDASMDWIILLSNNILNVYDEWPMTQESFDKYLLEKYGSYQNIYNIHHHETVEIRDSLGNIILRPGIIVPSGFTLTYFDAGLGQEVTNTSTKVIVTNYEYESKIDDDKRNIFILKSNYVPIILNDLENNMQYKAGGDQYVDPTLKRVDDIRLYEM